MRRGDAAAPRVPGVRLTYSELRVVGCETVTPRMRRVTLAGDGPAGFTPVAPDQQVKLFFARRHDWKLFAGDETALPAIGAWLESLGPDERAVVVAEVDAGSG